MKAKLLIPTIFFAFTVTHSQTTFQRTYGSFGVDQFNQGMITSDSNYIVTGNALSLTSGFGPVSVLIVKTNQLGDTLWTRILGGGNTDVGTKIMETNDNGFIVAGRTGSFSSPISSDFYLIRLNSGGDTIWTRTYGGNSEDWVYSATTTEDSSCVLVGNTFSFGAGGQDIYLIKTNHIGDTVWTKTIGSSIDDAGRAILLASDKNILVAGITKGFGAGDYDNCILKINSNGNIMWAKSYGGSREEGVNKMAETNDKGFIFTGWTSSFGDTLGDMLLVKADSLGNVLWAKSYGGAAADYGRCVTATSDKGYMIAGHTKSFGAGGLDICLLKTDSLGNVLWAKTYGKTNDETSSDVYQTTDLGFYITGTTASFGAGNIDGLCIKTDSNGVSGCNESTAAVVVNSIPISGSPFIPIVSAGGTIFYPKTKVTSKISPNTECLIQPTHVLNRELLRLKVFPNPFSMQTVLQPDNPLYNADLTVDNYFGQTVAQIKNINGQKIIFNRDNLSSGLYFVRLTQDNKVIAVDKLVIADK